MKEIITLVFSLSGFLMFAQNNLKLSVAFGHGNSSWRDDNHLKMYETSPTGDTLNEYDVDIHANGPTINSCISLAYNVGKITTGMGFSVQHFFINELITDAIYFEGSGIYAPTTFSPYNDPQPTHFKLSPFFEYALVKEEKVELYFSVSGGTFLTHSVAENSYEGFHWFVNTSFGLNYLLNEKITFSISPSFDYSRLNIDVFNDPERRDPYFNIYSFYTSFGVKYNFIN